MILVIGDPWTATNAELTAWCWLEVMAESFRSEKIVCSIYKALCLEEVLETRRELDNENDW